MPTSSQSQNIARHEKSRQLVLADRFRCLERLKTHEQIESWLGEDTSSGDKVFVKFTRSDQIGMISRLRVAHEARILQSLQTPSLARLVSFGETEDLVYLVTEFVPGEDLEQLLSRGPLDETTIITIGLRLLEALQEIHARNILHRDIKPSNIKVPSPAHATLVDFGLSKACDSVNGETGKVTGTLLYMAPEQLGLISREISPATDLYSVGVVLYECLAGRPPFRSESLSELLRKHLTQAPPPLSRFRSDVSERFERFLRRLLNKEPQERFVTAANAFSELQACSERTEAEPAVGGPQSFRQVHAPFVGRREQQRRLDTALEDTRLGQAPTVDISGVAGSGKTRMLDFLALQAVKKGFRVYRGQAHPQQDSGPFSLLEPIVEKCAAQISPEQQQQLRQDLADHSQVLAATFPALHFLAEGPWGEKATARSEARISRALRSLFRRLSSPRYPVLMIMDDLQWADAATRQFVLYWNSELPHVKESHCLLVTGSRPAEDVSELRSTSTLRLQLPPFNSEEIEELFTALDCSLGVSDLVVMTDLTAGNPLLVVETLRELSSTAGDEAHSPGQKLALLHAEGLFAGRVGRVSPSARHFLRLAAQLGQSFQPLGLAYAAGMNSTELFKCLAECRGESIIWEDATTGQYHFLHDRLRQHLLEALDPEEKAELHLRYAEYLSKEAPGRCYELAFHFDLAGKPEQASSHAVTAAREASRRNAPATATFYFRIAMKDARYARDRNLVEEWADCGMLVGDYPTALELYQQTLDQLEEPLERARLLGKLGELQQKMGQVGEASKVLLQAIEMLGGGVPSSGWGRRLETGWRLAREALRPSETPRPTRGEGDPRSLLLAHLYSRLSYVWFWTHGQADLLFVHLRHLQEAARHPGSRELAHAYAAHAIACIGAGQLKRAERFARLSLELRQKLGDTWGEAHAHNTLGIVLYAASRVEECIEVVKRAETLLDAAGDLWELAVCRYNMALCYYRKGELRRAREPAKRAYAVGLECGDVQASGVSLGVLVRCSPLEITEEQLERELNAPDLDAATKAWLLEARALRWLALGQAGKAARELEESWAISRELGRRTEYVASTPCWLATAYRKQLENLEPFAIKARKDLLRKLAGTVKLAVAWGKSFRNNLPHALREEAYLHALRGRTGRSLAALRQSLVVAEELGFQQELALTAEAQLRLKDALHLSRDELERFPQPLLDYDKLLDHGRTQSVSQLERFRQVLTVAARLTRADTYEAVFAVMAEAAGALFRTEDCTLLELVEDGEFVVIGSDSAGVVSQSLARHALQVQEPVTSVDELPLTESLMMAEIRSALCLPFGSPDSRLCCLQITHQLVGRLFADEELRVASYLSSLGTAALEGLSARETVKEAEELEQQRLKQLELLEARREGLLQSLGIASHDLKNLIFMAECVSYELRDPETPDDFEEALETLDFVWRKAKWLVINYLDIARAHQTGSVPCQASVFDLGELGQDIAKFMNDSLRHQSQKPRIDFQGESVTVAGDRDRVWQAVANIANNALIHTPLDTPIVIRVGGDETEGTLSVIDRGGGISPELAQTIFEPFVRAKDDGKGSGLGLWIAKMTVESSGGTLELESELGQGSTFRITLGRDRGGS